MVNENPLVSVIIPNRNRTTVLYRAVESVVGQNYKNWEIIIVDDSDEVIFKQIEEKYKGMQSIHVYTGDRKGDYGARCKGYALSNGEYVAFLDSDDYWDIRKLERHISLLAHYNDTAASWDNLYREKLSGERIKINPLGWIKRGEVPQKVMLKELMKENFIHMSCGVVRKIAINSVDGPFMESPFDYVLWINLATRYSFAHVDEYFTIKTDSADSLGSDKRFLFKENWNITKLKLRVLLKCYHNFSPSERLFSLMRIIVMSLGVQVLLPPSVRRYIRPLLYFRESETNEIQN